MLEKFSTSPRDGGLPLIIQERYESGSRIMSVREITGTNGKFWENAGISGKNREIVSEEWEIVGNSGKNWDVGLFRSFNDHKI